MLKQEVYQKAATLFGVSVGFANLVRVADGPDGVDGPDSEDTDTKPINRKEVRIHFEQLGINDIICKAIAGGRYTELQKNLYIHSSRVSRGTRELTIYKRAWKDTN
jgi:hypothetical protein